MVTLEIPFVRSVERKKGAAYSYRRQVPPDCREAIGRKNWFRTWRVGTPFARVETEALILTDKYDREIAEARGQEIQQIARNILADPPGDRYWLLDFLHQGDLSAKDRAVIATVEGGGKLPQESPTLTAALERDAELYGGDRDDRPFKYAVESFVKAVSDKDITAITRADAATWIASQGKLAPATVERQLTGNHHHGIGETGGRVV